MKKNAPGLGRVLPLNLEFEVGRSKSTGIVLLLLMLFGIAATLTARADSPLNAQDYDMFIGNFNGHPNSEVLYIAKDPSWPSGMASVGIDAGDPTLLQTWPSNYLGINWSTQTYNVIIADFNGDHRSDVLLLNKGAGNSYILTTTVDGVLAGISQTISNGAFGLDWSAAAHKVIAADFNGDGKADLFFQATSSSGTSAILLADTNGGLFTASGSCWSGGPHLCWSDASTAFQGLKWSTQAAVVSVGDFDGNGKADFLVQARPKIVLIDYDVPIPVPTYPPASNGVILSQASGMSPSFSVGQYFNRNGLGSGVDWSPATANVVVGDFNGDGRADVILQALRSGRSSYLFTGNANGTLATGVALASNVNWSADTVKLLAGYFGGAAGTTSGVYFQAANQSGISGFARTITGQTITLLGTGTASDLQNGLFNLPGTGILPVTAAGNTGGVAEVGADGTGKYTIPIELPPGINGLTPRLSIVYGHTAGPGLLGPRWTLAGLSAITRCAPTIAQDGVVDTIQYTSTDSYCLNGSKLRLVTGTGAYGAANSQYRTELESYTRITINSTTTTGPASFTAYGKDGLIYEFGNSSDSRVSATINNTNVNVAWALNKIRDRSENYIQYEYIQDTLGGYYPTLIKYTGNASTGISPVYTVRLVRNSYDSATAGTSPYVATNWLGSFTSSYLLSQIRIEYSTTTVIGSYNFAYYYGGTVSQAGPVLAGVQRCSTDACLAPTTVQWQSSTVGMSAAQSGSVASPTFGYPFDINGDGVDDLLYKSGSNSWRVQWGSAAGYSGTTDTAFTSTDTTNTRPLATDVDNDGRMDLLVPNSGNWWWLRYQSNGTFAATNLIPMVTTTSGVMTAVVDVNGDGYQDIVNVATNRTSFEIRYHNSDGTAGFAAPVTSAAGGTVTALKAGSYKEARHRNFDIDGDGREDLMAVVNNSWRVLRSNGSGFTLADVLGASADPIDVNSDHCSDLLAETASPELRVSKCKVTNGVGLEQIPLFGPTMYSIHIVDWNHDGYEDVLYLDPSDMSVWSVYQSVGTGLIGPMKTSIPAAGYPSTTADPFISDFDGNGVPDMTHLDGTSQRGVGARGELATSIRDGFGNSVAFDYKPTTANNCYTTDNTAPAANTHLLPFNGRTYVVCSMTLTDGTAGQYGPAQYTLSYAYKYAKVHVQGRGYAGFAGRTVTDSRTGISQQETYRQDFPFTGMLSNAISRQSGGTKISETTNTLTETLFGTTSLNYTHFPFVSAATTDSYEVGGPRNGDLITTATTNVVVDSYGSPTTVTSTLVDKDSQSSLLNVAFSREVVNTINPDASNWCLGQPSTTTVTERLSSTSTARVRTQSAVIDTVKCRVTQQTLEPSTPSLKVITDYGYLTAACGNVSSVTVTGYDAGGSALSPRTTSFDYGTQCRLVEAITNALGQQTRADYRYDLGLPNWVKDPNWSSDSNGLRTSWTYDGFGRQLSETRPDGTRTAVALSNCNAANAYCGTPDLRLRVDVTELDTNSGVISSSVAFYDGMQRYRLGGAPLVDGTMSYVSTVYDSLGRARARSVPYTSGSNGQNEYDYDILGRQTQARLRDASNVVVRQSSAIYAGRRFSLTDPNGATTQRVFDVGGALRQVIDPSPGGTTLYGYEYLTGGILKTTVTDPLGNVGTAQFNVRGFKVQNVDPDMGTWSYTYDSLGELLSQTDAKPQTVTYGAYDALGRPSTRTDPNGEGTTTWTWGAAGHNTATEKYIGRLKSVSGPGYSETYAYDALSRPKNTHIVADAAYDIDLAYNTATGFLETLTYPESTSGYRLKLKYDYQRGIQTRVSDFNATSTVFWQLNGMNARGEVTDEQMGADGYAGKVRLLTGFDPATGLMSSRQSGTQGASANRMNMGYRWDPNGNLLRRQDLNQAGSCANPPAVTGLCEEFTYDALNRLDYSQLNGVTNLDLSYNAIGNITNKSDIGSYTYPSSGSSSIRPHAVTTAGAKGYQYDANGNMTSRDGSSVGWNSANLPTSIAAGSNSSQFAYTPDRQRWRQIATYSGTTETTIYVGGLMEKVTVGSTIYFRHYIAAGENTVVYARISTGTNQTYFVAADHLGSFSSITDAAGALVLSESFDAFGKRRGSNWTGTPSSGDMQTVANATRRGFTGHEHLDNLALVHMNGRVQDPGIGRFLSADPLVQAPDSSQSWNRYSYVWNNPLGAADPTGFRGDSICRGADCSSWACSGGCVSVIIGEFGGEPHRSTEPQIDVTPPPQADTKNPSGRASTVTSALSLLTMAGQDDGTREQSTVGGDQTSPAPVQTDDEGERRAYPRAAALRRATAEAAFRWLRARGLADFEFTYQDYYARDLVLVTGWRGYDCGEDPTCGGTAMLGAHTEGSKVTMFRAGVEPELWPLRWYRSNATILDLSRQRSGAEFWPGVKSDFEFAIFIIGHESWHVANPGKGGQDPRQTVAEWTANDQGWMYLLRYRQQLRRGR